MATVKRKVDFFATEQGVEIEEVLRLMTLDVAYNTSSSYTANTTLYPDNSLSFVEKHKNYLIAHPAIDPNSYVANLRLMTRLR